MAAWISQITEWTEKVNGLDTFQRSLPSWASFLECIFAVVVICSFRLTIANDHRDPLSQNSSVPLVAYVGLDKKRDGMP